MERIARLLCEADGHDPDCLVYPHAPSVGPRGLPVIYPPLLAPAWMFYRDYVQGTVDTLLTGSEDTDLRTMMAAVLSGEEIPIAIEEQLVDPTPVPDWRYKMGLKSK